MVCCVFCMVGSQSWTGQRASNAALLETLVLLLASTVLKCLTSFFSIAHLLVFFVILKFMYVENNGERSRAVCVWESRIPSLQREGVEKLGYLVYSGKRLDSGAKNSDM